MYSLRDCFAVARCLPDLLLFSFVSFVAQVLSPVRSRENVINYTSVIIIRI